MSSPFPGMDPFLEAPVFFGGLQTSMICCLRELLQPLLPEPYYADITNLVWVERLQPDLGPDVIVTPAGNVPSSLPVVVYVPQEQRRESLLEIFKWNHEGEQLVTTIELLNPSNKTPGQPARDQYLRKQRDTIYGKTHLVEIDLLRGGQHTTAVPLDLARERAGPFDYHVCIHHFDNLEDYFVYPILLSSRLPVIAIPLLPGDSPVAVDLQIAFDRSYDTGPYHRRVYYTDPVPPPALAPAQAAWVQQVLREKGLLPPAEGMANA